jgi:hypothetical protein
LLVIAVTGIAFFVVEGWIDNYFMGQLHWSRAAAGIAGCVAFMPVMVLAFFGMRTLGRGNSN